MDVIIGLAKDAGSIAKEGEAVNPSLTYSKDNQISTSSTYRIDGE
jgi:hypothetical protein